MANPVTELPAATGDYAEDCSAGRRHAGLVIDYMRISENPLLFPAIVRGLPHEFSGVEVGFLQAVGAMLANGGTVAA